MGRVRLNLKSLTVTDKIAKARQIITAMTDHASFPNPSPALTNLKTAVEQLEKTFALVQ